MKHTQRKNVVYMILAPLYVLIMTTAVLAAEEMRPVVVFVTPENEMEETSAFTNVSAVFSKDMNPQTINEDTFLLVQRTTPATGEPRSDQLAGVVAYHAPTRTAVFTPSERLIPNQIYGNVYTTTITTEVEDTEGNPVEHDYIWSFTTGSSRYNTLATAEGMQTAQQNDTASAIAVPAATPPATTPPSTTTTTPTTSSWWTSLNALVLYAIAFLIIIGVLYMLTTRTKKPTTTTSKRVASSTMQGPFGDIHPVSSIQGIGPEYTKQLRKMNIQNTKQLWMANAKEVATTIGANTKTVRHWQRMAELMAVKGIGGQYAELLERSGVRTIEALAESETKTLLGKVQRKQQSLEQHIQGNTIGESIVTSWITAANDHQNQMEAEA